MIYVFYDTDRLLSCALFCFYCSVLIIFFFRSFIQVLLVELYMCLFCISDSKGGLWSSLFYLYVYVVCSSFLFSYFCAWFVMCGFCFFLFLFHSHLHSPVHCILSLTVFNNQSCVITIGPIAGRPWATKVRRCNWVPARSCWGNCKSCFYLFILRANVSSCGSGAQFPC